jgi:hypothetical protein
MSVRQGSIFDILENNTSSSEGNIYFPIQGDIPTDVPDDSFISLIRENL